MPRAPAITILLALLTSFAPAAAPKDRGTRSAAVGPVRFDPPRGWARVEVTDRNVRVFAAPTGDATSEATLAVAVGEPSDPADFDFRQRFHDWISTTLVGMEVTPRGAPKSGTSRQGLKSLTQRVVAVNGADRKVYARFISFAWENRIIGFSLTANSEKLVDQFDPDLDRVAAGAVIEKQEASDRDVERRE